MPLQHGPGPKPFWRPTPPQITPGPLTGQLGAFVSNTTTPQIADYSLLAGVALVIASAVTPQGQATAAEYQYGTHAQAIAQAENLKSDIWLSLRTPQAAPTPAPLRSIWAAPESIDLSISGWAVGGTQANQGPVPPSILIGQVDPSQLQPQVWKAATAAAPRPVATFFSIPPQTEDRPTSVIWRSLRAGQTPPVIASFYAEPQQADLTQQGLFVKPGLPTGPVPPATSGAPQANPSQIAAQVWKAQIAAPITPNPIASFFATQSQIEDRPTSTVWQSQRAGQTPPVIRSLWAAPQQADLTQKGVVVPVSPTAPAVLTPLYATPQQIDLTQQGLIFSPSSAPVAPAPSSLYAAPQQLDLTQQGWVRGTAPVKQGPVPPFTSVPITDLSQTLGYQIAATIFVSVATPSAAPPNLHKLYLDVTTGRLYWQVSQTSNPTLIIPL